MLIIANNKTVLDFPSMLRIALRYIFEPHNVNSLEMRQLQESIISWQNHINLRKEMSLDTLKGEVADQEYDEICLEYIGGILYDNETGKLERRKGLFRKHNIDWKKFYRLPEAYKKEDFYRAQHIAEEHKRTNPEDYV